MKKSLTFIVGAGLGAAAALFVAPSSGKKLRKKVNKESKKLQMELQVQAEKGLDKVKDFRSTGMDRLNEWKESAETMAEEAAKNINGTTDVESAN